MVLEPEFLDVVVPRVPAGIRAFAAPRILRDPHPAKLEEPFVDLIVIRRDHAPIADRQVLNCVEAEAPQVADGAQLSFLVLASTGVGGVFNELQVVPTSYFHRAVEIDGVPSVVYHDDRLRQRGDQTFYLRKVDVECFALDVAKNR